MQQNSTNNALNVNQTRSKVPLWFIDDKIKNQGTTGISSGFKPMSEVWMMCLDIKLRQTQFH